MTAQFEPNQQARKHKVILLAITLIFLLSGFAYGVYYHLVVTQEEQTDNAYVGGNLVTLTAQVTGNVQEIRADETQMVKAGAEVIRLDPVDSELALRQVEAKLGASVRQLRESYANVLQYDAVIVQRKLNLQSAEDDFARRAPLAADHTLSTESIAHARQAVADAKAALDVSVTQSNAVHVGLAGVNVTRHPSVLAAKVEFIQAWLAMRRNAVLAPVSGYVAKRSIQVGAHVTPGMPLMSIVPLDQLWVDANFKESELQNIRAGQPALIQTDLYGDKVEYHGKVVGMSAGTGSAFSLLPTQNATGNWIKVVQRVPVRISLDPAELTQHPLRIGLSTVATIDTHHREGAMLGTPMPATPVYATQTLSQPTQVAELAAENIISKNLVSR